MVGSEHPERLRISRFFLIGAWMALCCSLAETAVRVAARLVCTPYRVGVIDPLFYYEHDAFWMAPLADVLTFLALGIVLLPVALWASRKTALRVSGFVWLFVAVLTVVAMLTTRVHWTARLVLVAGIAVMFLRVMLRFEDRFLALVERTTLPMALATLLLAIAGPGWRWFSERRAEASLPPAKPGTPNVLLITLDTVRAENLDLCGYSRQTAPLLTRFAAEGAVFPNAIAPSCWTLPTHASLFTGYLPSRHRADYPLGFTTPFPTIAERLQHAGLITAGFYGNNKNCGRHTGLGRGFIRYRDFRPTTEALVASSPLARPFLPEGRVETRVRAPEVNEEFLDWLDHKSDHPFFVFLNYFDAHPPYEVPDPAFDRFTELPPEERAEIRRKSLLQDIGIWAVEHPDWLQLAIDTYDGAIAYLDYHLNRLLEELRRRNILQNTIVIITSDHGEHFGEHSIFSHGNSMYRQEIGVPLVLWYPPSVSSGFRINEPVSLMNLPATILEMLGLTNEGVFPGQSLLRYLEASGTVDETVAASEIEPTPYGSQLLHYTGSVRSVVAEGYHYLRKEKRGTEELYEVAKDPQETRNLVRLGVATYHLARLRRLADDIFGPAPAPSGRTVQSDVSSGQRAFQ
jgi:arylsulfatase A-like enzyme